MGLYSVEGPDQGSSLGGRVVLTEVQPQRGRGQSSQTIEIEVWLFGTAKFIVPEAEMLLGPLEGHQVRNSFTLSS